LLLARGCGALETGYKVGDCMTLNPITVSKDTTIIGCARIMRDKRVGSLIVEERGKLAGLVTEQDMVRSAIAEGKELNVTRVEEIMIGVKDLITIEPEKDLFDALTLMRDYSIRHLPVMQRGNLVGFLTAKDVLKIQPQLFEILVEKYELREESRKPILSADADSLICAECKNYSDDLEDVDGKLLCAACRGEALEKESPEEEEEF
jgi:CBS domain-containing protein